MLYPYKRHPERSCCSFRVIAVGAAFILFVLYSSLLSLSPWDDTEDLSRANGKVLPIVPQGRDSIGSWASRARSSFSALEFLSAADAANPERAAILTAEQQEMEDEYHKQYQESLRPKDQPVQPLDVDALKEPDAPGHLLLNRRDALVSWITQVASIQEIEWVTHLKNWVSQNRAQQIAESLGRLSAGQGWSECAKEHGICECTAPLIRYGHDKKWVNWIKPDRMEKQDRFRVMCDNDNFGGADPVPYVLKTCECYGAMVPMEGAVGSTSGIEYTSAYCGTACSGNKPRMFAGKPRPRSQFCARPYTHERLWSCDRETNRVPDQDSAHREAQDVLDAAVTEICRDSRLQKYLDVFLDCDYAENFMQWTSENSDWLEEAFVTYIAGKQNSPHEWMANNLIRSVMLFSSRPIVVVVFDTVFVPPAWWKSYRNVIVYRMLPGMNFPVSFNFNKIRAMIASRIIIGIELDVDQIVAPGIDRVFPATRKESTSSYPFPLLPVHWMSRDAKEGEQFYEYGAHYWHFEHGMRWCHAHPSWSFWSLVFLADLMLKRYLVGLTKPKGVASGRLWALSNLEPINIKTLISKGEKVRKLHSFSFEPWMMEDEDMLNIELWYANATKAWCKFDLEPELWFFRHWLGKRLYSDPRWYPDGVPLMFFSAHNTKDFEKTDALLTLLARCSQPDFVNRSRCSWSTNDLPLPCRLFNSDEREARKRDPDAYAESMCCCLQPRQEKHIFWGGEWYARKEEVPKVSPLKTRGPKRCILI
eukprot:TRINITY_DN106467_c0_g1_i1.p1 TRINITY_DN106467_c0_g1~~TRINITY_DN106467_c0_g1_i1.p1  ORF type:complete len:760 (+),score=113.68 TRINITY_DN106467_c0_g1_i1:85-2364(+)